MIAIIHEYQKELLNTAAFADKTVEIYTACIQAYCDYAKTHLNADLEGTHICQWIPCLKKENQLQPPAAPSIRIKKLFLPSLLR